VTNLWLPPLLNEIADVIGTSATLTLAHDRGGSRIYIPAKVTPDHWLVDLIGLDAAEKLADHYAVNGGGQTVDLPVGPSSSAEQVRKRVDELLRENVSADEIARTVKVHRTTVFRRKRDLDLPKTDPRQGDLFG